MSTLTLRGVPSLIDRPRCKCDKKVRQSGENLPEGGESLARLGEHGHGCGWLGQGHKEDGLSGFWLGAAKELIPCPLYSFLNSENCCLHHIHLSLPQWALFEQEQPRV